MSWLPDSPFRSPAWRWQRASWLAAHSRPPSSRIDDEWVSRARHLLTEQIPDGTKTSRSNAAIREALACSRAEPPERRWLLESYLLTTLPLGEISQHCGVSINTAEAYHELFFEVRPHLDATDWIMARAIGTWAWRGFAGQPLGMLWRYVAYTVGPSALEVIVAASTDQPFPATLLAALGAEQPYSETRLRLAAQLMVGLLTARSAMEVEAFVGAHDRLERLDRQTNVEATRSGDLLPLMGKFLQGLRPRRRQAADQHRTAPPNVEAMLEALEAAQPKPTRQPSR